MKLRAAASTTPSSTPVLLAFILDPPSSLFWLDMNGLILEGRKTNWNCLSEIAFYLSQDKVAYAQIEKWPQRFLKNC